MYFRALSTMPPSLHQFIERHASVLASLQNRDPSPVHGVLEQNPEHTNSSISIANFCLFVVDGSVVEQQDCIFRLIREDEFREAIFGESSSPQTQ